MHACLSFYSIILRSESLGSEGYRSFYTLRKWCFFLKWLSWLVHSVTMYGSFDFPHPSPYRFGPSLLPICRSFHLLDYWGVWAGLSSCNRMVRVLPSHLQKQGVTVSENRLPVSGGRAAEGRMGRSDGWGIWDGHAPLLDLKWLTEQRSCYVAQGALLSVMWQPGWERVQENGDRYDWVPLVSTWNYHNTVNELYSNIK